MLMSLWFCYAHGAQVLEFYSYVHKTAQLEKDCVEMSLFYRERLLAVMHAGVMLTSFCFCHAHGDQVL